MSKTSTAAVVRTPGGEFLLETVELDDLRTGEVLVKIEAAGVCHTDMNMQHVVPMPAIFGHEGAGVVEETGPGVDIREARGPGDHLLAGLWRVPQLRIGSARHLRSPVSPAVHRPAPRWVADGEARRRVDIGCLLPTVVVRHPCHHTGELARPRRGRPATGTPCRSSLRGDDRGRVHSQRHEGQRRGRSRGLRRRRSGAERGHGRSLGGGKSDRGRGHQRRSSRPRPRARRDPHRERSRGGRGAADQGAHPARRALRL